MIKVFFTSFIYTLIIIFGGSLLGFFSNIAQLTEWNILNFLAENKPWSYYLSVLIFLIIYASVVIFQLIKINNRLKNLTEYPQRKILSDGVLWEWDGKDKNNLVPLCPKCKYELDWVKRSASEDNPTAKHKLNMTFADEFALVCSKDGFEKGYGITKEKNEIIEDAFKELQALNRQD